MSTLSKVFVVVNFVLAIVFMVASLVLYAKKVDWVEATRKSAELRAEETEARQRIEKEYTDYKLATSQELTRLKQVKGEQDLKIDGLTAELETAKQKNDKLDSAVEGINSKISDVRAELKDQAEANKKLEQANKALRAERDEAILARDFADSTAIEAVSDLKAAQQELLQMSKEVRRLVERNMEQSVLVEAARKQGFDPKMLVGSPSGTPPVTGRVLEVEEEVGIVILNVGETKNVRPGMEFVISRGSKYITKVRVRNIYEDMCSAVILEDMGVAPPEVSDLAQTM